MNTPRCLGSYSPPKLTPGGRLRGSLRSAQGLERALWLVESFTSGEIRWPCARGLAGRPRPIIAGDLERALRREACCVVSTLFGVSRSWVRDTRLAMGIDWWTEGTQALWSDLASDKLGEARKAPRPGRPRDPLPPAKVAELRRLYAQGVGPTALGRLYGLSPQYAGLVARGARRASPERS